MHPYLTQELARQRAIEMERVARLNAMASQTLVAYPREPRALRRALARRVIRAGLWLLGPDPRRGQAPVARERRVSLEVS